MATHDATPEDTALVASHPAECVSQFSLDPLAASMLRFYNLLATTGHWPLFSIHVPPQAPLSPSLTGSLRLSPSALGAHTHLPFPNDRVVYDRRAALFPRNRFLDLTDPEDLEKSRDPTYSDSGDSLPPHILTLAMPRADGSLVLLDTEIGAIWHYHISIAEGIAWRDSAEYRVARQQQRGPVPTNNDALKQEELDMEPLHLYAFLPPTPAAEWFDAQYARWHSLRRLPFLDPEYDGDRDMDLDEVGPPGSFRRSLCERKQSTAVELMGQFGWPLKTEEGGGWDREGFVRAWEEAEKGLHREALAEVDRDLEARGELDG
ncbi:uncharacterized protein HMPREF1541_00967 [Cyphellophora europaea CBS 101466]|uniref:Uncharacterized protein n=1 Tax=Cyphellophora europaea (strain CBS 101466) TaxID=1220924 RepID=W2SFG0_CYPE1|nr:uncharacterized protein HMPREF1541_00967 [Cyphellophora europaea CBS 101466]ETN46778.1 hypothetical protein HMPREF1541_00967 [Cyphellophora europaea CBS 101466]